MSRFLPLDGSVLLRHNGVFSEHQVYHNDAGELFARKGSGYLRLMAHHATSGARVFWDDLNVRPLSTEIRMGRVTLKNTPKVVAISRRNAV